MDKKLNSLSLGYAGAIISALMMLLLGVLGNLGYYKSGVEAMKQWHIYFSLSFGGIIMGIIEGAVVSFLFLYLFGWLYNKLGRN